ncbi:MAG TPA: MlaD family protein, partial [Mycobacterium sp.]
MHLTRRAITQLVVFVMISIVAVSVMILRYIDLPVMLFGAGHYRVTVELPQAAGLYESSNVTYRGTEVGRVKSVSLTRTGAQAVLSLSNDIKIPADLHAEVHSQSAIGEQYVALLPTRGGGPYLENGDVIPVDRASVPPDINSLLGAANRGLQAIPRDNLKTVVDEAYTAFAGLGPEISRIVRGSTTLAIDARSDLDSLTTLIDEAAPVLNSQTDTSDSIR